MNSKGRYPYITTKYKSLISESYASWTMSTHSMATRYRARKLTQKLAQRRTQEFWKQKPEMCIYIDFLSEVVGLMNVAECIIRRSTN